MPRSAVRLALIVAAVAAALLSLAYAADYRDHGDLLYFVDGEGMRRPVRSAEDWEVRRGDIVAGMERVMGPLRREPKSALEIETLDEVELDGYRRRTIRYQARRGDWVAAYLLIPDRPGRRPAVLALHPTGALGKGIVVGLGDRANRATAASWLNAATSCSPRTIPTWAIRRPTPTSWGTSARR